MKERKEDITFVKKIKKGNFQRHYFVFGFLSFYFSINPGPSWKTYCILISSILPHLGCRNDVTPSCINPLLSTLYSLLYTLYFSLCTCSGRRRRGRRRRRR